MEQESGWKRKEYLFPVLARGEETRKTDEEAATRRKEGERARKGKRWKNGPRVVE